jgi:hypothetical protein
MERKEGLSVSGYGPALLRAGQLLYDELAHAGFGAIAEWENLEPSKRDDFVYCVEGMLTHWQELLAARAELEHHQSA